MGLPAGDATGQIMANKPFKWSGWGFCTLRHISQAVYEQAFLFIDRPLRHLQPSAQPEARQIMNHYFA
jgi:hypothetical protein